MCHNVVGTTETRRWSADVEERTLQSALPITNTHINQRIDKRGTCWDCSRSEDDATLEGRGTAWDNVLGTDEGTSLGPKVGTSGGKPQPLYGNALEQSRFRRRTFDFKVDPETVLTLKTVIREEESRVNGDKASAPISAIYSSGSWKRHDDGASFENRDVAIDTEGTPAGPKDCSDCGLRRKLPRSVLSPDVWIPDVGDSLSTASEGKPTPIRKKLRERKTEDIWVGWPDAGDAQADGGVPMPL